MVGTTNIYVTSYDTLEGETNGTLRKTPVTGNIAPSGLAGITTSDGIALCHVCATDDELRDDEGNENAVFGDEEVDYPGLTCDDCHTPLDTRVLVYESHNPELHYRLKMTESLAYNDELLTIEEIAEKAEEEAYNRGYADIGSMEGEYGEGGEYEGKHVEVPTDSAQWANVTAPNLRALAGYVDPTGKGTFTDCPNDNAYHIHNEVIEAYNEGYYDAAKGEDMKY